MFLHFYGWIFFSSPCSFAVHFLANIPFHCVLFLFLPILFVSSFRLSYPIWNPKATTIFRILCGDSEFYSRNLKLFEWIKETKKNKRPNEWTERIQTPAWFSHKNTALISSVSVSKFATLPKIPFGYMRKMYDLHNLLPRNECDSINFIRR